MCGLLNCKISSVNPPKDFLGSVDLFEYQITLKIYLIFDHKPNQFIEIDQRYVKCGWIKRFCALSDQIRLRDIVIY